MLQASASKPAGCRDGDEDMIWMSWITFRAVPVGTYLYSEMLFYLGPGVEGCDRNLSR